MKLDDFVIVIYKKRKVKVFLRTPSLKNVPRAVKIDIEHQGYGYVCRHCGTVLSSLNQYCCSDPDTDTFDL